jgi:glyoxylase-like metal-dependent hydrolase (beta-lactamase superfamily II)
MTRVGFRWLSRGSCSHPEVMTIRGGSLCAVDFPAMVGVIRHPDRGLFLFDTGYDPAFFAATVPFPERFYRWTTPVAIGAGEAWANWLATHGIASADLSGVILSHFHGDHVAGMRHVANLPLFCSAAGLARLRGPGRLRRVSQGLLASLVPSECDERAHFFEDMPRVPIPSAFTPFEEGRDLLGDGSLIAVELPGHCPGHWGLAFHAESDRPVLLAGDAVWSGKAIEACVPPPRLTTALLGDTRAYRTTLAKLHQVRQANSELAILPSHCSRSAAAYEATERGHDD